MESGSQYSQTQYSTAGSSPISKWIYFLLDLFGYASFNMTSKVNRNSSNTTKYWVKKLFLLLDGIQDDVVLDGKVWIEETFIKVKSEDIGTRPDGKGYRGQSRNQMCIGIACNKVQLVFFFEGYGKTSARKIQEKMKMKVEKTLLKRKPGRSKGSRNRKDKEPVK